MCQKVSIRSPLAQGDFVAARKRERAPGLGIKRLSSDSSKGLSELESRIGDGTVDDEIFSIVIAALFLDNDSEGSSGWRMFWRKELGRSIT